MLNLQYGMFERTSRRDGRTQITCKCDAYRFPHRLGSGLCEYNQYAELCSKCSSGECVLHGTRSTEANDSRSEALTAAERNKGMRQHLKSGKGGWL